jgi:hypothetical protein
LSDSDLPESCLKKAQFAGWRNPECTNGGESGKTRVWVDEI